jgi:hypothetical protein
VLDRSVAEAFTVCERYGWAWCPGAVERPGRLLDDVADIELVPLEPQVGAVRQAGATGVGAIEGRPHLAELADSLERSSRGWRPDEVAVGRYGPGGGISAHRDNSFYTGFVVVLTIVGEARFEVSVDRGGVTPLGACTAGPGDLVLLRGPRDGPPGAADARPFHAVGPPLAASGRTVLVLRRNSRGAGRGWA